MTIDPATLLRQLGSGVRPAGVSGSPAAGAAPATEGAGFADLLRQAREGTLSSNLPVTVARDAKGVKLSDDQLARISLAADRAEAAGIRTALVLIDDQQVVLDVKDRTVTGAADLASGVLGGIDGVVTLTDRLKPADVQPVVGPPGSTLTSSASLSRLLSGLDERSKKAS